MEDKEIIKALECCTQQAGCNDCPFVISNEMKYRGGYACAEEMRKNALDLINRQKAEIESLKQIVEQQDKETLTLQKRIINWRADIDYRPEDIKSEAIKEFAERLKEKMRNCSMYCTDEHTYYLIGYSLIDELVKEMVGD